MKKIFEKWAHGNFGFAIWPLLSKSLKFTIFVTVTLKMHHTTFGKNLTCCFQEVKHVQLLKPDECHTMHDARRRTVTNYNRSFKRLRWANVKCNFRPYLILPPSWPTGNWYYDTSKQLASFYLFAPPILFRRVFDMLFYTCGKLESPSPKLTVVPEYKWTFWNSWYLIFDRYFFINYSFNYCLKSLYLYFILSHI